MKTGQKIIIFLFALLLASDLALAIDVTIPNASAPAEKTFTLEIRTTDLTGQNIFSVDFKIIYDATILTATSVSSAGTVLADWGTPTFNIGAGEARVSSGGTAALKGSGALTRISFRAAAGAVIGATSPMAFAAFMFNEGNPGANLLNGTFTVIRDSEAPQIIVGPSVASVTSRSALIRWSTDEPATSIAQFGLTSSYGQEVGDQILVTDHAITLSGLKASKTYHYRVGSIDKPGNGPGWSSDQSFMAADIIVSLPDLALDPGATLEVPITTTDLTDQDVSSLRMAVRFNAELLIATGVITEGTLTTHWPAPVIAISSGLVDVSISGTQALSGGGVLLKLQMKIAENARIGRRTDLTFEKFSFNAGEPPATIRNGSFNVKDTRAPQIINDPIAEQITSNSAIITWSTNENSTSTVEFGKSIAYGYSATSSMRTIEHQVALSGLDAQTRYHFRVSSKDSSGNGPTISSDYTFSTAIGGSNRVRIADATAPVGTLVTIPVSVTDLTGQGVFSYHAVVQYDRKLMSFLGIDSKNSITSGWNNPVTDTIDGQVLVSQSGSTALSGSGQLLQMTFQVRNEAHNTQTDVRFARFLFNTGAPTVTTSSGSISLTGNPDTKPPRFVFGPVVDQISTQSARILWYTDEPASSKIFYGRDTGYGQAGENPAFTLFHSLLVTNLTAGTEYHAQALSLDPDGNGPLASSDLTFKTLTENGVAVTIADVAQPPGSNFIIPITTGNLSGLSVYSVDAVIKYDSQVLTATQVTSAGTLTAGWGDPVYTITPGRILIPMAGVNALANAGSLINIQFSVNPNAVEGVQTPIAFERLVFNDGVPRSILSTGALTVKDVKPPLITKGPVIFALAPQTATVLWATQEPAISIVEYGTGLNYGELQSSSLLTTGHLQVLSGLEPDTRYHLRVGSVDLAGNGPTFSPDVIFITPSANALELSLPRQATEPGTHLRIPILISDVSGLGITALDFNLFFDAGLLDFIGVSRDSTIVASWSSPVVMMVAGGLHISLAGASVLAGAGRLVQLDFAIPAAAPVGASSFLTLSNLQINGLPASAKLTPGQILVRDQHPPVISAGPFVSTITTTSAEISWLTDEPANSQVDFGPSLDYGQRVEKPEYTQDHHIRLTGLRPGTAYHFRVASTDSFGNGPILSSDVTFQTLASQDIIVTLPDAVVESGKELSIPVLISDVTQRNITSCNFILFFDQQIIQVTRVSLEGSMASGWPAPSFQIENNSLSVTLQGSSALSGQGALVALHLQARKEAVPGSVSPLIFTRFQFNNGSPQAILENGSVTINDKKPPVITTGPFSASITSTGALIYWQTDESANSQVDYGTTANYGKEVKSSAYVRSHQLELKKLQSNTEYHFRVQSSDALGNGPVISEDLTFMTAAEGGIQLTLPDTSADPGQKIDLPIWVEDLTGRNINRFTFDLLFDSKVVKIDNITLNNSLTRNWSQPVLRISENQLQASLTGSVSLAGSGPLLYLSVQLLATARPGVQSALLFTHFTFNDGTPPAYPGSGRITVTDHQPPTIIAGPFVTDISPVSAVLVWLTEERSTSRAEYGPTPQYGEIATNGAFVKDHQIELSGLIPNSLYHYRVGSTDSLGNGPAWSTDATFTTATIQGIYIALPDTGAGAGAMLSIPIRLRNLPGQTLQAVDFSVVFNPTILELTDVEINGTLSQGWTTPTVTRGDRILRVQMTGSSISASGTLVRLIGQMKPGGSVQRYSSLIFANFSANNGTLAVITRNGSVKVLDTTPPLFLQVPVVTEVLFNRATLQWQSDEPTTATIEYGPTANYGTIARDSVLAQAHQYSIVSLLPGMLYHFRVGIMDSSGNGPVYSQDNTLTTLSGELHVTIPDTSAPLGNFFLLPIRVSQVSGHNITRVEFKLTYDKTILLASGAIQQGSLVSNWMQPLFSDEGGQLRLVLSGTSPLKGAGVLVYIGFQVSNSTAVGASSQLTLSDFKFNQGSPSPTSIISGKFTTRPGLPQNAIRVNLPDTSAFADQEMILPVQIENVSNRGVVAFDFTVGFSDSILVPLGIDTTATLVARWSTPLVTLTTQSLRVVAFGAPALSDSGVLVYLRCRTRYALVSGRSSPLIWRSFKFNQGNPPADLHDGHLTIRRRPDVISGFVFDSNTRLPLDSAQVHLEATGGGHSADKLTDDQGYFIFSDLDTFLTYTLMVARSGYLDPPPVQNLGAGADDLRFFMEPRDGYIEGTIRNPFKQPVVAARVSANDGHGSFGSANSDSLGYFRISGLNKSYSYSVTITHRGFYEKQLMNVQANSNLQITLDYHYASITGEVKYGDGSAVVDARIILTDTQNPIDADSVRTGADGGYRLTQVVAGSYIVVVRKPGYLSEPEQHELTIGPGQTLTANFSLEPAVLSQLTLQGQQELPNNQPSIYYYTALTETGRKMGIGEPIWRLQPAMAGSIRKGLLTPNPTFLGEAWVSVADSTTGIGDTLAISIYAPVGPQTRQTFRTVAGASIGIVPGSFKDDQKLKLNMINLPPAKQSAHVASVQGQGFQLKPDELALEAAIQLTLPFTGAYSPRLTIGKWDKENAEWLPLEATVSNEAGSRLSASIHSLGLYAVLIHSRALGFETVRLSPNPFSPDLDTDNDGHAGLTIYLNVSSLDSRQPLVTIKIYNLVGDLVRALMVDQPVAKDQEQRIYWDGLTDDGRLARNGRYLIRTEIQDAQAKKEHIDGVVLIR